MEYKVYVSLGFHINFYHSWRGDTPDEAGFGTDIRVVRRILEILNEGNVKGLQARGYWDTEVYWTFENILPSHAPDITDGIRQRVETGQDEILVGPYNNGANHAATEDEFRAAIALALENPYGSGLKQIFGKVAPYYRSQESMQTAGQNRILLEEGIEGVLHYYAGVPFNTLSTFIPVLPLEQQYNPLRMKCAPEDPPIILWPCVSMGDVLNHISLEMWLLELRHLQMSGKAQSDLLLHINFDADAESWLPFNFPKAFSWFPNCGGLVEYIQTVNKYRWAEFTLPSEYIQKHPPQGEILVFQDLADGSFDGNTSWAEKYSSLQLWSILERSRLHSYRAEALVKRMETKFSEEIQRRLWHGLDSSFFQRMIGLSTTHFGMSTPVINEERQAKAESILGTSCQVAMQAEREASRHVLALEPSIIEADHVFEIYNYARGRNAIPHPAKMAIRVPVILPPGLGGWIVMDVSGKAVHASVINVSQLPEGFLAGEITFVEQFSADERKVFHVISEDGKADKPRKKSLQNPWIEVDFSENTGIESIRFMEHELGGNTFLQPFITYHDRRKKRTWFVDNFTFEELSTERWDGLSRVRIHATIPMETSQGQATNHLTYTFSLYDNLPYLFVDVEAQYAYITPCDMIQNIQQKLRRLIDLNWIEVAPFQLRPSITAATENPLRVWKHNFLGITSSYVLNYGRINPRNKNLDAFNHQVTAGWVAISNGEKGMLIAENTQEMTSMAFCPMRLREVDGIQHLYLNPFGTFHGKQMDYSHLPGNGLGAEITGAVSNALNSSAPSFNGQTVRFSLMLAPYFGDSPPKNLQNDAAAFFYPFGVLYRKTPAGLAAVVPEDMRKEIKTQKSKQSQLDPTPIPEPTAFLANPTDGAVTLVWDTPGDDRITSYEARWKKQESQGWQTNRCPPCPRWTISNLENGEVYSFQIRTLAGDKASAWTHPATCIPGPIKDIMISQTASSIPLWTLIRMAYYGLVHGIVTRLLHRTK
jgi:hypothetical protein